MVAELKGRRKHEWLKQRRPEIREFAEANGVLAAAMEFGTNLSTVQKHIAADKERRGETYEPRVSVNKIFLHENGESYFEKLVTAIVGRIATLQSRVAELEGLVADKEAEISRLRAEADESRFPQKDEDSLLKLVKSVNGGEP